MRLLKRPHIEKHNNVMGETKECNDYNIGRTEILFKKIALGHKINRNEIWTAYIYENYCCVFFE